MRRPVVGKSQERFWSEQTREAHHAEAGAHALEHLAPAQRRRMKSGGR